MENIQAIRLVCNMCRNFEHCDTHCEMISTLENMNEQIDDLKDSVDNLSDMLNEKDIIIEGLLNEKKNN